MLLETSNAQIVETISLGGAQLSPTTVSGQNGAATLMVGVATSVLVPNNATATVELVETSNFNGVSYTVTPARRTTVTLTGGGVSTTVRFTIRTSAQNDTG